jgi:hypothetical protein
VFQATSGWSIHIGKMPKTPDTVILINRSGGRPSDPKWLLDYPNVQVRVRGPKANQQQAEQKAVDIKDRFLGLTSETQVSGDRWVSVTMLSDIAPLGYDENERPEFSINFAMIVEPAVPANTNREALA